MGCVLSKQQINPIACGHMVLFVNAGKGGLKVSDEFSISHLLEKKPLLKL